MDLARLFKALADPNRLRAMAAMENRELCVCQIVELLNLAPSTVSKHLSLLADAGLLNSEKRGRWVYYAWSKQPTPEIATFLEILPGLFAENTAINEDRIRLSDILAFDPEALCRAQSRRISEQAVTASEAS